jgi:hypothetical protein
MSETTANSFVFVITPESIKRYLDTDQGADSALKKGRAFRLWFEKNIGFENSVEVTSDMLTDLFTDFLDGFEEI